LGEEGKKVLLSFGAHAFYAKRAKINSPRQGMAKSEEGHWEGGLTTNNGRGRGGEKKEREKPSSKKAYALLPRGRGKGDFPQNYKETAERKEKNFGRKGLFSIPKRGWAVLTSEKNTGSLMRKRELRRRWRKGLGIQGRGRGGKRCKGTSPRGRKKAEKGGDAFFFFLKKRGRKQVKKKSLEEVSAEGANVLNITGSSRKRKGEGTAIED